MAVVESAAVRLGPSSAAAYEVVVVVGVQDKRAVRPSYCGAAVAVAMVVALA